VLSTRGRSRFKGLVGWAAPPVALLLACCLVRAAEPEPEEARDLYIRAAFRQFDYKTGVGIVVGDVHFVPPRSDRLVIADAGVIWLKRKEAYLEGNIRIHRILGPAPQPGAFDVPRPDLDDRTGLEPGESLERAGDLDDVISEPPRRALLLDPKVPASEAERVYVNWADGTAYLVRPTFRFAEADRIANWVVTAPSAEGIATYRIPVYDRDGTFTGKFERRRHYVMDNATFTACTFKRPHTRFTATSANLVEEDRAVMKSVRFHVGEVPVLYFPLVYKDVEHDWPWMRVAVGTSSRMGRFGSVMFRFQPVKGLRITPRVEAMSERGVGLGLGAEYHFGHEKEIRGALDAFWIPNDYGEDELANTSRTGSGWPAGWPPALGPLPSEIALDVRSRYRIKFVHQQEWPKGLELDVEVHKFSDAGVYREYFEDEFKTEKPPETRLYLQYGRDNWAFSIHVKKQINDFLTQTEYLPQFGFNWIAEPIGGGLLFSTDTEVARVRTRFGDVRRRLGQSNLAITRIWLRRNEYSRPPALTLRQNDSDSLTGWRADTVNVLSYPFELSVFDIEPYVGWRGTWFERGVHSARGAYGVATPPVGPPLPPAVAAAPRRTDDRRRSQLLAGGRIATQFHRTYDVHDRPILRRLFPHGQRHIVTPEIRYTYESDPGTAPRHLPDNDSVTAQGGLHRINFALRNRWQTRWAPKIERDPRAPLGGEWHRRRLAVEKARASDPVNVIDLDMDIDLFLNPERDNVHLRGRTNRRWSNLRTDLTFRPSRKATLFLDTEFAPSGAGHSGAGGFEVISAGFGYKPSRDVRFTVGHQYHFHDASLLRAALEWEINPKWRLGLDVQQDFSGGGSWDRRIEVTRRFHEWQLTIGYEFDKGKGESLGTIHVGPTRAPLYRPSWRFQPRSIASFELAESAR
jgi:hypothetical protein